MQKNMMPISDGDFFTQIYITDQSIQAQLHEHSTERSHLFIRIKLHSNDQTASDQRKCKKTTFERNIHTERT